MFCLYSMGKAVASMKEKYPTKFEAQLWTVVYGPSHSEREEHELWAVIMLDGDEAGFPCAFGPQESMEKYAVRCNESKGVLA